MTLDRRFLGASLMLTVAVPLPVVAQEIVQPLPPPGAQKLSSALERLARNSQDVSALLDAGDAALEVGDVDAAIGFFGRANQLSPGNSRVKLGLGRAYVRSRRPIEALRLFAEAEQAGISNVVMAEERGLAFDLVGDAKSAQELYRLALDNGAGDEIARRLAVSLAISGDREGFEAALLPILEKGDVSAFRSRAFGLAILGDTQAAFDIANTMLSAPLASQMRSYLEFMPKLTQAQQAAAANLGIFPRSGEIGTDSSRIAQYEVREPALPEQPRAVPAPAPSIAKAASSSPTIQASPESSVRYSRPTGDRLSELRARRREEEQARQADVPQETLARSSQMLPSEQKPVVVAEGGSRTTEPATQFAQDETAQGQPALLLPEPSPSAPSPPQPAPRPANVAAAFDDFSLAPSDGATRSADAVDISAIDIPRERARPEPPPPPAHPSRHWVQVATGKDRDALGFDWRRISRKADGKLADMGPFVTPWGEANRLLAGPYDSASDARALVNELKTLGIDSFPFTSDSGQEIEPLD